MKKTWFVALVVLAAACTQQTETPHEKAVRLAHELILIDTHVDIPYRLHHKMEDISGQTPEGDYDYVRGKEGGLDAPFMSIYVPAESEDNGAHALADTLIRMVEELATKHPDKFALAFTVDDVRKNFEKGLVSLPMGMENGSPIDHKIENVKYYADKGIRYITLAHSKANHLSNSSYDPERPWKNGISPFGEEVVAEMNRLGIMVDISHLSDDAANRVLDIAKAPVLASHSCCRAFTPDFERNISDDLIARVKENDGVVMIAFGSGFLTADYQRAETTARAEIMEHFKKMGWSYGEPEAMAYIKEYQRTHEIPYATVKDVADHIDHVVKIAGVDHVGFGSDFDGVGDSLPIGLKSAADYPNLIEELLNRGYADEDIKKICGENLLRVWSATENIAQELQR